MVRIALDDLPFPAFVTDESGRLSDYNEALLAWWPELDGREGRAYSDHPFLARNGKTLDFEHSPMGVALRERRDVGETDLVVETGNGSRRPVSARCRIFDDGDTSQVLTILIDTGDTGHSDLESRLAAIVDCSNDAIISKRLDGTVTSWNQAATRIYGYSAEEMIGQPIHRLFPPDREDEEDKLLAKLKQGEHINHYETKRVTKDGRIIDVSITISPVRDGQGQLVGASKIARDITDQKHAHLVAERLAAIVNSSDDAIVSKDLDGIVTSWNAGAQRIFGYTPEEMVGRSIKTLIPDDLLWQEDEILAKLRRGERVDHFDTVRVAKNGQKVHVSLTISPMRDSSGRIIGASKIARDVTGRKRAEEYQALLIGELNHRVKNTLATVMAVASQSMRAARDPELFVEKFTGRVRALAAAHDLIVEQEMSGATLMELVRSQVVLGDTADTRISCSGPDTLLDSKLAMQMALVLHEMATNARKYGALALPGGQLRIAWEVDGAGDLLLRWKETGLSGLQKPEKQGFGMTLVERTLAGFRGSAEFRFEPGGLQCDIRVAGVVFPAGADAPQSEAIAIQSPEDRTTRVLVVEDEPLVAIDIAATLRDEGYAVAGPASRLPEAMALADPGACDVALLDGNLNGDRVDALAEKLAAHGIPFAFVSGYGRDSLPEAFSDREIIAKPFQRRDLLSAVARMLETGN